jgi:hypothetical protein
MNTRMTLLGILGCVVCRSSAGLAQQEPTFPVNRFRRAECARRRCVSERPYVLTTSDSSGLSDSSGVVGNR